MAQSTYSFGDVSITISHPSVGQYTMQGEGIGSISVNMATDRTVHDTAADGSVMISKIRGRSGAVGIVVQQTSPIDQFLRKWFNYLETADSSEWADSSIIIRSAVTPETISCTGVSPQKQADRPFQAQGQQVTWNLMAADIQQDSAA